MSAEVDEQMLEQLYAWIDSIPLSRPKKDLKRDFSDGGIYKVTTECHVGLKVEKLSSTMLLCSHLLNTE